MKETDEEINKEMEVIADMHKTIEASIAFNKFADGCSCKGECKVCHTIYELHFIRDMLWFATGKFENTYDLFYKYDKYGSHWWEEE